MRYIFALHIPLPCLLMTLSNSNLHYSQQTLQLTLSCQHLKQNTKHKLIKNFFLLSLFLSLDPIGLKMSQHPDWRMNIDLLILLNQNATQPPPNHGITSNTRETRPRPSTNKDKEKTELNTKSKTRTRQTPRQRLRHWN